MKNSLMILGAAALFATGPALAKPGNGHGNHGKPNKHHNMSAADHAMMGKGYGTGACPPGLAKKNANCMPPGQMKKLYNVGQRYPSNLGYAWNYNQVPYDLRSQYGFQPNYNYYYNNGYLYQVDPKTLLIQQVVSALLR